MTVHETVFRIRHWPRHKRISYLKLSYFLQKNPIRKAELLHALQQEVREQLVWEIDGDLAA